MGKREKRSGLSFKRTSSKSNWINACLSELLSVSKSRESLSGWVAALSIRSQELVEEEQGLSEAMRVVAGMNGMTPVGVAASLFETIGSGMPVRSNLISAKS
jgi:hypothetical protein